MVSAIFYAVVVGAPIGLVIAAIPASPSGRAALLVGAVTAAIGYRSLITTSNLQLRLAETSSKLQVAIEEATDARLAQIQELVERIADAVAPQAVRPQEAAAEIEADEKADEIEAHKKADEIQPDR